MRHCLQMIILFLIVTLIPLSLSAFQHSVDAGTVEITSETTQNISLTFRTMKAEVPDDFTVENLPVISKYVVIPPLAAVRLEYQSNVANFGESLFPAQAVEISDPIILRGIRMVQVIIHPVQFDTQSREFVQHESLDVNLRFTDNKPINPLVYTGTRRNQSPEFALLKDALNLNVLNPQRDDGEIGRDYTNHYLVVTREECLPYAIPLIEWKRHSGVKVDIIKLDSDEARDVGAIQESIQTLYNDYLEQGIDPFESILILGDRAYNNIMDQWNISSHRGQPTDALDYHADYIFGCLEGDDFFPEASVGRFVSGNADLMQLAVARTLAYEMAPDIENPEWFERAGLFTQNWEDFEGSITYTVRWGEQALRERGFSEVRNQEADEADQNGNIVGPVLAEWFNDGMSIMLGRARMNYWEDTFRGVGNNAVFPIYISTCAHGEDPLNRMFRTGDADNLKGAVAAIASWGDAETLPNNNAWLGIVSSLMIHDLSLGWSKIYAGFILYEIFSGNDGALGNYQTQTDLLGDPGIKPWVGIPRIVSADCPETISPGSDHVEITVYEENSDNVVTNAQVTLYYPGELPNDADYHEWQPLYMKTAQTNRSGKVKLPFDPSIDAGTVYLTVTGRDIYPLRRELEITMEATFVAVESYQLDDANGGNGDGNVNPGETIALNLNAFNYGSSTAVENLQARIRSASPYIKIERPDTVVFGDVPAGERADANRAVLFTVSPGCPDGAKPEIHVDFTSTNFIWRSIIKPEIIGFDLEVNAIAGSIIVGSEERNLEIEIINKGRFASPALTTRLEALDYNIKVLNGETAYPAVDVDATAENNGAALQVSMREFTVPGYDTPMQLVFYLDEIAVDTAQFMLQTQESETGPIGPDDYGYYCYDNTDTDWPLAPSYNYWLELDPGGGSQDYEGIEIELFDTVYTNAVEVIDLPFTMCFYGREYNQITVGINGFVGVGDQRRNVNFQNSLMDKAIGGPMGMIAPLWTSLTTAEPNNPTVYWYYDDENEHIMIIEWHNVHFAGDVNNTCINFEIIIYNPEYHPSATGDSDILFKYMTVMDFAGGNNDMPYVSVGISSPDGKTGINYSFRNTLPPRAAPLENRRALLFTTNPGITEGVTTGLVYDRQTNEVVTDVTVKGYSEYGVVATGRSNENGEFTMLGMMGLDQIRLEGIKEGYRGTSFELDTLNNSDTLQVELYLLKPSIRLSSEEINKPLARNHRTRHYVKMTNNGAGDLDFTISLDEPTSWLNIEPRSGFLHSREFVNLAMTYDTRGLDDGDYDRIITIEDAFAQLSIDVPLHLNVAENNGIRESPEAPLEWSLNQNYPNPFNSSTTIDYSIKDAGFVELNVYDLLGRSVLRLVNEQQEAGKYSLIIDSSMLPTGLYIYRLKSNSFVSTRKMINMK
ncbi:T9SS type A sorting domain-containing protein [bacterium]|nr:T9SS type A sorting domain-containing protein [bacterium]